jgi:hypothetical protein
MFSGLVHSHVLNNKSKSIILLREKTVISWLFADIDFLRVSPSDHICRKLEHAWGKTMVKKIRPGNDSSLWSGVFGEQIAREIYELHGHEIAPTCPIINKTHPDIMTNTHIIEAKSQAYSSSGTASEKILGCPLKYANVPMFYEKPLHIVCIGKAEEICRDDYGIFNCDRPHNTIKNEFLSFYKSHGIEFKAASQLLVDLL